MSSCCAGAARKFTGLREKANQLGFHLIRRAAFPLRWHFVRRLGERAMKILLTSIIGLGVLTVSLTTLSAVEPAHRAAIEKLMEISGQQASFETSIVTAFETSIQNSAAQMPAEQRPKFDRAIERVKALMIEEMGWEQVKGDLVEIYAKHFTQQQIEAILPLFEKPEMQLFVAKTSTIVAESSKMGGEKVQALTPKIMAIIQEEMSK